MPNLEEIQHLSTITKEIAEIVMFSAFSQPAWKVLFDTYLEHLFLPAIAISFTVTLAIAWYEFNAKKEKEFNEIISLFLQTLATTSIVIALSLKVAGVPFVFGPHLFLCGILLGMVKEGLFLLENYGRATISSNDHLHSDHAKNTLYKTALPLLTKTAIFFTILCTFVLSSPPILVTLVSALSALLTVYQLVENLFPPICQEELTSKNEVPTFNNKGGESFSFFFRKENNTKWVEPELDDASFQKNFS